MIVEKAAGMPFHVFMEKKIFKPLGMDNTLVFDESKPEIKNKVIAYNIFEEKDDYNLLTAGAGGIFSTVEDLLKWDQALYTNKLISQETLKGAFTPATLNDGSTVSLGGVESYGFGWSLVKFGDFNIVKHGGSLNGFQNMFIRELNNRIAIITLSNNGPCYYKL